MLEKAQAILQKHLLCDNCLGRQFALLGYGLSNKERGIIVKNALVLENYDKISDNKEVQKLIQNIALLQSALASNALKKLNVVVESTAKKCELCRGLFEEIAYYSSEVISKIKQEDFESFLIGARVPEIIQEFEDQIRASFNITSGEALKEEFTREIGKYVYEKMLKKIDFNLPDITIIIDLKKKKIFVEKRSLYLYGRYKKFIRTIPQTKWPCWECKGKGCQKCNNTGKLYLESIEELIAAPIMKVTGGTESKFHGAGREDIDALMLGDGRPFVLEIKNPQIRIIDLKRTEKIVNRKAKGKVEVKGLDFSDKKKVQDLKGLSTETQKTYRALVELENEVTQEKMEELITHLRGIQIKQKTPKRVLHRRADLERIRTVYDLTIKHVDKRYLEATITSEGGLYIKELISGDDGRTQPSFSSILGTTTKCIRLDVIKIHKNKID